MDTEELFTLSDQTNTAIPNLLNYVVESELVKSNANIHDHSALLCTNYEYNDDVSNHKFS